MATVDSHALAASPLEKPATLIEKYCGSCNFPNTPSAMATTAPSPTAISTATPPPDDLAGTAAVGASASDIAVPLNPNGLDLDTVDRRDAVGRQLGRGRGRAVLAPLHAGHSPAWVDDPAVANACVVVYIESGGRLGGGSVEVPLLFADPQGADDRIPLEAPVEPARLVLVGQAHSAVDGATPQPRLDRVAVAGVGDRLVAVDGDLQCDRAVGGRDLADVVRLGRKGRWRRRARRRWRGHRSSRGSRRGRLAVGVRGRGRLLLRNVHEQYADPEHRNGAERDYRTADFHNPLLACEQTPLAMFCLHNGRCREMVQ